MKLNKLTSSQLKKGRQEVICPILHLKGFWPPKLNFMNGVRGYLLYNKSILKHQTEAAWNSWKANCRRPTGSWSCWSDLTLKKNNLKKPQPTSELYRLLESLFYYPMMLIQQNPSEILKKFINNPFLTFGLDILTTSNCFIRIIIPLNTNDFL